MVLMNNCFVPCVVANVVAEELVAPNTPYFHKTPNFQFTYYILLHNLSVVNTNLNSRVVGNKVIIFDDN
jgi:hypothetical protein